MTAIELAQKSWALYELKLSGSEIETLRFLLYRAQTEKGTPPDTRILREEILAKLEEVAL